MDLALRVVRWARLQSSLALPEVAVPGTTLQERAALAALGGVAAALAGDEAIAEWPGPIRAWAVRGPRPPSDLIDEIRREGPGGLDVLAQMYEQIVSGRSRRRLGTFFTPPPLVDFMLDRAVAMVDAPSVVIDPGAGVGAFSLAARARWPGAEVVAVDVNLVTLGLLAARADGNIALVLDDYLSWASGTTVPPRTPRLWIGNPPYTRHQELPSDLKQRARSVSGGLVVSGLAGLSAYFLAATLNALAPNDAMCLLLPGSWTDTRYGRPLRAALRDLTNRPIQFYGLGSEAIVFPGTLVSAVVVAVGPQAGGDAMPMSTSHARLDDLHVEASRPVRRSRHGDSIERLGTWLWRRAKTPPVAGIPLREIARVRRGVATGANSFFLLTDTDRARLPPAAVVRAVRRMRHLSGDRITPEAHDHLGALGERRWLLRLLDPALLDDPAVSELLKAAVAAGVPRRYLASHRDPWYVVESVDPPDLIISPMGKRRMRVIINEVRAIPTNSLYGLYVRGDPATAERLAAWLNEAEGQASLLGVARAYGAGLFKLEPRDLEAVRVPAWIAGGR